LVEFRYVVTRTLAEATSLDEGIDGFLSALAHRYQWDYAFYWALDDDRLRATQLWHAPDRANSGFIEATRKVVLGRGEGLPGKVMAEHSPVWVDDVADLPDLLRPTHADREHLGSAVCFPVLLHDEMLGVAEFYSGERRERDPELRGLMAVVGGELAHFISEKRLERRLVQKIEAGEAMRARTDFLSRVSHELRTPLNSILGFAQLLEMTELSARQEESVEQILKGGRHLLQLIDDVLDISRIDSGTMSINPEAVQVRTAVANVVALLEPLAAERRISIEREDIPDDLFARADGRRLRQVLLNLLSNAIKYNHEDGCVRFSASRAPAGRVRVEVTDTGLGISSTEQAKLFRPFERLSATRSEVEGTGLGLALSKQLLESMGGTLSFESALGEGSTFAAELAAAEPPTVEHAIGDAGAEGGERPLLLYVDREPASVELVRQALTNTSGLRLINAATGVRALELAAGEHPDLVVVDLDLRDMDGEEFLERLKGDPATRSIPVVAITAEASEAAAERLLARGADGHLGKPLRIKRLVEIVDESLGTRTLA
jgi:signal transduction histidine kinase/ActR/RegA family two-component response regulator